jgi:hypothetical protein
MPETSRDVFFGKQANFQSDTSTGNNDGHSHSIADDATTIGSDRKRKQKTTNAGRQEELLLPFSSLRGLNQKHTRDRNRAQPKQNQITIIPRTRRRKEEEEEEDEEGNVHD